MQPSVHLSDESQHDEIRKTADSDRQVSADKIIIIIHNSV